MSAACLLLALALVSDGEEIGLTLDEAIQLAARNNLGVQGAVLDAEAAEQNFNASWGTFDTTFYSQITRTNNVDAPSPATFSGGVNIGQAPATEFDIFNVNAGLRGLFENGASWQIDWNANELKSVTPKSRQVVTTTPVLDDMGNQVVDDEGNPVFVTKLRSSRNEIYTSDWSVSLTQPLLEGSGSFAMSSVELAAQDVRIAGVTAQTIAQDTLTDVITTYWNLVFARQDVATRELSVELAQELSDITQRKYDQGLQNRLDVIETEAEVANRKEQLLTARTTLEQAEDDLRRLVFAPEELHQWVPRLQPLSGYEEAPLEEIDEAESVQVALRLRPDVRDARLRLERARIELERAENTALPRLDLTGSYGQNSNEPNLSNAITSTDSSDFREARVFLDFEMPISNRQAGYAERQRRLARDRQAVTVRETEMNAIGDVRTAVRDLRLQIAKVEATAETTRLRQEAYDGETRRLENDLSTPYLVRESQRDLLEAIDNETRARLDLAVARTNLLAARGQLLETYGFVPRSFEPNLEEAPPAP